MYKHMHHPVLHLQKDKENIEGKDKTNKLEHITTVCLNLCLPCCNINSRPTTKQTTPPAMELLYAITTYA